MTSMIAIKFNKKSQASEPNVIELATMSSSMVSARSDNRNTACPAKQEINQAAHQSETKLLPAEGR